MCTFNTANSPQNVLPPSNSHVCVSFPSLPPKSLQPRAWIERTLSAESRPSMWLRNSRINSPAPCPPKPSLGNNNPAPPHTPPRTHALLNCDQQYAQIKFPKQYFWSPPCPPLLIRICLKVKLWCTATFVQECNKQTVSCASFLLLSAVLELRKVYYILILYTYIL